MGGRTVSKRASGQMVTTGARASTCVLWLAVLLCVAAGPSASAQAHTGARQRGMASGRGDSSSIAVHHDTLSEKNQMQQKTNVLHVAHQQLDEGGDNGAADDAGVKTASKEARLDPANFVVVIIASLLLIYCSHRALHPPFLDVQKMSSREREEMRELEEAGEMPLLSAFLFVFVASLALLLIFYFMSAMSLLITILFSFIATISLGAALYPYADNLTGNKFSHDTDLPLIGPVPTLAFLLAPVCILTVALWLFTKNWLLNNILAISLIVFFLTTIRISNLMVNTVLLVLAFFYDIFWVFCSSAVFGSNVMVTVATQLDVPIKILVPLFLSAQGSEWHFTLIGLGDIVLPGLLLSFAMRFDHHQKLDVTRHYFAVTMAGYIAGLTCCEVIVGAWHLAQPAMIYLVPGTLLPFISLALVRGELGDAWNGISGSNYIDIVEERP